MTDHLNPVLEVPDEDFIFPASSSPSPRRTRSQISPIKEFSPQTFFRHVGYQRMPPSDGEVDMAGEHEHEQELHSLEETGSRMQSPPLLPHTSPPPTPPPPHSPPPSAKGHGLGISVHSRTGSVNRVPVGARRTPTITSGSPDTPRSFHGLMASPGIEETIWETQDIHSKDQQQDIPTADSTPAIGPDSPRHVGRGRKKTASSPMAKLFSSFWPYGRKKHATVGVSNISTPTSSSSGQDIDYEDDSDSFDDDKFHKGYSSPPSYCRSRRDIQERRTSWLSLTIFALSLYSTILSAIWFVVAIVQPRWGRGISSRYGLHPSTAATVAALVAKSIEMSFVTVFISFLGQVLTRRALLRKGQGMTLAEMTMRNWVIQPGSLATHWETVPTAGLTVYGLLALTATVAATFYTTASDAMIAPKLKHGDWEPTVLEGHVRSSYANVQYASGQCPGLTDIGDIENEKLSAESCMSVQHSGQSYRNLMNFMRSWSSIHDNATDAPLDLRDRPAGTTLLFDNTTMSASWIETETSNVTHLADELYEGRIVNNVSMAMPHPGVYQAATDPHNGILQPDDLAGVGEYSVRAGVVSPAINVMCVNMDEDELEPLVYTLWEDANTTVTDSGLVQGHAGWVEEVPRYDEKNDDEYLNRTVVDDIFRWGPDYKRKPPIFQLLPPKYNMVVNSTVHASDSIYILGSHPTMENYTLCELKSWVSPKCSTHFDISGTTGATMRVHCEDPHDEDSYLRSWNPGESNWTDPATDWKWFADSWRLSMDLDGGVYHNNASNARILTQLALTDPSLSPTGPSMAEALAVFASSTLTTGAIDTPFAHVWPYNQPVLDAPGPRHAFNATVRTQQYTSGHVASWQTIFYVVLGLVLAINVMCLVYFVSYSGLVTDFTEPQNIFTLAVNSPTSVQLKGSCGAGPEKRDLVVPWRVAYAPSAHHYFFEEANHRPWKGKYAVEDDNYAPERHYVHGHGHGYQHGHTQSSAVEAQLPTSSYKRLSTNTGWI